MSYHINEIKKGKLGELSKVKEELEEALDAEEQGCDIMVLLELSDMIGAVEAYLKCHHPSISLKDLTVMSELTQRAFKCGCRK